MLMQLLARKTQDGRVVSDGGALVGCVSLALVEVSMESPTIIRSFEKPLSTR